MVIPPIVAMGAVDRSLDSKPLKQSFFLYLIQPYSTNLAHLVIRSLYGPSSWCIWQYSHTSPIGKVVYLWNLELNLTLSLFQLWDICFICISGAESFSFVPDFRPAFIVLTSLFRRPHCDCFSPVRGPDVQRPGLQMGQYPVCIHSIGHEPCTNCTLRILSICVGNADKKRCDLDIVFLWAKDFSVESNLSEHPESAWIRLSARPSFLAARIVSSFQVDEIEDRSDSSWGDMEIQMQLLNEGK